MTGQKPGGQPDSQSGASDLHSLRSNSRLRDLFRTQIQLPSFMTQRILSRVSFCSEEVRLHSDVIILKLKMSLLLLQIISKYILLKQQKLNQRSRVSNSQETRKEIQKTHISRSSGNQTQDVPLTAQPPCSGTEEQARIKLDL